MNKCLLRVFLFISYSHCATLIILQNTTSDFINIDLLLNSINSLIKKKNL